MNKSQSSSLIKQSPYQQAFTPKINSDKFPNPNSAILIQSEKRFKLENISSPYLPSQLLGIGTGHGLLIRKAEHSSPVTPAEIMVKSRNSFKENRLVEKRQKFVVESLQGLTKTVAKHSYPSDDKNLIPTSSDSKI